ncbi:MAG: DsbE family thiol:disulfide interchange protein [Lautropia sp.]|nr:DsbE family thiol:disulfide interchange protein [Lautropia sp.]
MEKKSSFPALRFLLPAAAFLALAIFLLLGLGRNPNEIPSPLIDKPAPAYRLPLLTGAPPSVRQQAGHGQPASGTTAATTASRVTTAPAASSADVLDAAALRGQPYLLNVWASWCLPCLQEHPQLLALARLQQIRLVGMNYKDKAADAIGWLRQHGNPYDDIIADTRGRVGIDFGVYGVPETFLIDGEGRIRFKHTGVITPEVLQRQLLPAMAALKEQTP